MSSSLPSDGGEASGGGGGNEGTAASTSSSSFSGSAFPPFPAPGALSRPVSGTVAQPHVTAPPHWPHFAVNQMQQLPPQHQQQLPPQHQHMHQQQVPTAPPASRRTTAQSISFGTLLPLLLPTLPGEESEKLLSLYESLKKSEVSKEDFLRSTRLIVGDQLLVQTVKQMQMKQHQQQQARLQRSQSEQQQQHLFPQQLTDRRQEPNDATKSNQHDLLQQSNISAEVKHGQASSSQSHMPHSQSLQMQVQSNLQSEQWQDQGQQSSQQTSSSLTLHKIKREVDKTMASMHSGRQYPPMNTLTGVSGAYQMQPMAIPSISGQPVVLHGQSQPHQIVDTPSQHLLSRSVTVQPVGVTSTNQQGNQSQPSPSLLHVKEEPLDSKHEQVALKNEQIAQRMEGTFQSSDGSLHSSLNSQSFSEEGAQKIIQGEPHSSFSVSSNTISQQVVPVPVGASQVGPGNLSNANAMPVVSPKSEIKRPLESVSPTPTPSKKQKATGAGFEQSIDQLNDVTAVSGVNLREEEEQLLVGPKEESRASSAMRRVVQEEEGKLFLEKAPLHTKVAEIAVQCGLMNISDDVERCLSVSTEERLRAMIYKLIRLSAQRCDEEKESHKIVITSDLHPQISSLQKKAKEEQEKRQQKESERLSKLNEKKEKSTQAEKSKDDARAKATKAQKEEEDKLRANAANLAARAAAGVDDMLIKWQLMAEQARQKREGESGKPDGGNDTKAATSKKPVSGTREVEKKQTTADGAAPARKTGPEASSQGKPPTIAGSSASRGGIVRKPSSGNQATKGSHTITLKDVVALLETDPHMAKSSILYQLYERKPDSTAAGSKNSPSV